MTDADFIASCHKAKLLPESLELMLRLRRLVVTGQDFASPEIWAALIRDAAREAPLVVAEFQDFHAELLTRGRAHFTASWGEIAAKTAGL